MLVYNFLSLISLILIIPACTRVSTHACMCACVGVVATAVSVSVPLLSLSCCPAPHTAVPPFSPTHRPPRLLA